MHENQQKLENMARQSLICLFASANLETIGIVTVPVLQYVSHPYIKISVFTSDMSCLS